MVGVGIPLQPIGPPPFQPGMQPGMPMGQPQPMGPGMMANQYPPYNPSIDAQYMGTHPDYVDPGAHRMTGKQIVQWFAAGALLGFFLGALFMFQLYEPLIRVLEAVRG